MNTNEITNTGMNIEDYEDQAVKKSKLAKGIGIAAGAAVGGAAIAAGTTYAATTHDDNDTLNEALTADEIAMGAEVGEDIEPTPEPTPEPTTQYVYVEKPAPEPEPEPEPAPEPEPEVVWDETTNYYVGDEKVMSVEKGTVDGHDFMLVDADADGHADVLAIDVNNNHQYEADEIIRYTPADHVHMGHETAHTIDNHYMPENVWETPNNDPYAYNGGEGNEETIHNNFEDEKTGEEYHGDFADNNPDYNPTADVDYGSNDQYLAENYGYDGDDQNYHAGIDTDSYDEPTVEPSSDLMADSGEMPEDSYDDMMDSEEFLG